MNREIKFRAWIKHHSTIITQADYYDATMVCNGDAFGVVIDDNWIPKDNFVIMQYTGLKDKNGVEIYEGDVIKSLFSGLQYLVNYKIDRCAFYAEQLNECYLIDPDGWNECIIIGNIYQNPELLK